MKKIIAIVVTHNCHASLVQCINALRKQSRKPDAILVVNNGSADFTTVWLDNQTDLSHINQENAGTAGGFHTGIKWAYDNGYTWVWCMNDKGYPKENALEMLIENASFNDIVINSAVINKQDKKSFVFKTNQYKNIEEVKEDVIDGVIHPFNGTLIHRSVIEKVGLPLKQLYMYGDGSEYFHRIVDLYKIPAKTITKSIHYLTPATYSHQKDWDYKSSWKMYFYLRNKHRVLQTKYTNKWMGSLSYLSFIACFTAGILLYQKTDKLKKLNFVFWPAGDALRNNYSKSPEMVMDKMNKQLYTPNLSLFFAPLKSAIYALFVPPMADETNPASL